MRKLTAFGLIMALLISLMLFRCSGNDRYEITCAGNGLCYRINKRTGEVYLVLPHEIKQLDIQKTEETETSNLQSSAETREPKKVPVEEDLSFLPDKKSN